MQKFKYILQAICLTLVLGMVSCTDLDEVAYSKVPADEFLVNEENLVKYAGRAYTSLQRYPEEFSIWTLGEMASDEMVAPGRDDGFVWDNGRWNELHAHSYSPTNKINSEAWNFIYQGISACNEIIYTTTDSDMEFREKAGIVTEMEILGAYFYYLAMDRSEEHTSELQ